jgi:hypothetical protein
MEIAGSSVDLLIIYSSPTTKRTAAYTIANIALTKSRASSFIVSPPKKGSDIEGFSFWLIIAVDYGLAAIAVSVFLLDHSCAVPWLSLLDHGGITITITVAVLITRLAHRYASADWTDVNTNFIRQRGRRDSDSHSGSN